MKARKGTTPVIIVTSVPWERERDITVIAVITARPANRRSVSDSDVIVVGSAFILPRAPHYLHASIGQSFGLAWANRTSGRVGWMEFRLYIFFISIFVQFYCLQLKLRSVLPVESWSFGLGSRIRATCGSSRWLMESESVMMLQQTLRKPDMHLTCFWLD